MFIPVSLSTPYEKFLDIFEIPILGALFALIIADLPVVILSVFGLVSLEAISFQDSIIIGISVAAWNFFLRKRYKTVIRVIGIPFDIFGLLIIVISYFFS